MTLKPPLELHGTDETLNAVVHASPTAIVTLDLAGRVMTWNPAAERMHGWTAAEVIGRPLPVLPADQCEEIEQVQAMILREGGLLGLEHPCYRKDGSAVMASISGAPLHNCQGEVTGAVYLVSDITEQKRTEEALQRAKEQAEAASRAKSEFLANMSHEIRTPMNGVLGMIELALATGLTNEQRDYLDCAKSSAEWLLQVLNDILDFSKIEAGKLALSRQEFPLRETLEETIRPLTVQAQLKGLELGYEVDAAVPEMVVGDPTRLRQVLVNLISNGIKFTPAGGVSVRVTLRSQDPPQVRLSFAVTDTGIGVALEKQTQIFEAFTQADGSITRQFGGTGLGLSISSQLARIMGGSISLQSEPGAGSTFQLLLPFGVAERAAVAEVPGSSEPNAPEREVRRHGNILLVEDNHVNQVLVRRLLEKQGFTVATANDGLEALGMWEEQPYDVILMDVQMPQMDGFEATRRIRTEEVGKGGHVPIIALTAHAMTGDRERCLEAGMDDYVTKPINFQDLVHRIDCLQASASSS